jgi:hypothetical protein
MGLAMMNNSTQNNQCDIARYYYNLNHNVRIKIVFRDFFLIPKVWGYYVKVNYSKIFSI